MFSVGVKDINLAFCSKLKSDFLSEHYAAFINLFKCPLNFLGISLQQKIASSSRVADSHPNFLAIHIVNGYVIGHTNFHILNIMCWHIFFSFKLISHFILWWYLLYFVTRKMKWSSSLLHDIWSKYFQSLCVPSSFLSATFV